MSSERNTPWEILHAGLAHGPDSEILGDGTCGISTVRRYFVRGGPYLGEPIFVRQGTNVRVASSRFAGELQRHPNQFLAYFYLMGFDEMVPFSHGGGTFKLADLVDTAKYDFNPSLESTFTLLAFVGLEGRTRGRWTNQYGEQFTLSDIVRIELGQPATRLACGGTHSLYALCEVRRLTSSGDAFMSGGLKAKLEKRVLSSIDDARRRQQPDGSFLWEGEGRSQPLRDSAIFATGHTLEWLTVALDNNELAEAWVQASVVFLCKAIRAADANAVGTSALYHAVHALRLYRSRLFAHSIYEAKL